MELTVIKFACKLMKHICNLIWEEIEGTTDNANRH